MTGGCDGRGESARTTPLPLSAIALAFDAADFLTFNPEVADSVEGNVAASAVAGVFGVICRAVSGHAVALLSLENAKLPPAFKNVSELGAAVVGI
jgi:hypothetical protein